MSFLKNRISNIDPFLLLLIAISLIGIWPILVPGYIITDDAGNHLYRLVAFDQALREGDFYPRWFPEFAQGFGDAELSFYAPFSYYMVEFIHLLGFGLYFSLKLTFAASLLFSGIGMYWWVSEAFSSRRAGFVAAIGYMYFPYRMSDIYFRGALAECVALVFLPFLLWSTYRLIVKGDRFHTILAGVFLALLVIAHNVTALFFMPVWLGYAALLMLFGRENALRNIRVAAAQTFRMGVSLFVGLSLSVFYWLPALMEQGFAYTAAFRDEGIIPAKQFSAFSDLIQNTWLFDYAQKPFKVGFIQLLAFLVGICALLIIAAMRKRLAYSVKPYVSQGLFFVIVVVACLVLVSPAGLVVWNSVPLADFIQFPWRLLSYIGLGTSLILGLLALSRRSFFFISLPVVALLVFSTMSAMSLPRLYINEDDLTIPQAVRHEFDTGFVGGTCFKEYVPTWGRPAFLLLTETPAKLAMESEKTESALSIIAEEVKHNSYKLGVSSGNGGAVHLHQLFFPGWQARVDGKEARAYPSAVMGLVTVDVPEGEHQVELFFGDTTLRSLTRGFSLLMVVALAGGYLFTIRRRQGILNYGAPVLSVAMVGFYFFAGMPGVPQTAKGAELAPFSMRSERFDLGPLQLAGFELDSTKVATEGAVRVVLYWQSLGTDEDIDIRLEIKDAAGKTVGSRGSKPIYGTARTSYWSTDELVKDEYYIPVETAVAGRYSLEVSTGVGPRRVASAKLGNLALPGLAINKIVPASQPIDANFGDKIRLLGYRAQRPGSKELSDKRTALSPGEDIELTLFWKAINDVDADYSVFLHLLDVGNYRWEQLDAKPRAQFGLTSQWLKVDPKEDHAVFHLPEWLPRGVYRMDIGVYNVRTMERLPINGTAVNTLTLRSFKVVPKKLDPEAPVKAIDTGLGGVIRLDGAAIGNDNTGLSPVPVTAGTEIRLPVKLLWQAEKEMDQDYTVFIHVLDATGKAVAQIDSQPMKGGYPTSYWTSGERVPDEFEIMLPNLPSGEYRLLAGVYSSATMARLTTGSGEDSINIGSIQIK